MSKLRSRGRGRKYSLLRGLVESLIRVLYAGGWPAELWGRTPGAARIESIERNLSLRPGKRALRLAFASDLHLGPTTSSRTLDAAFERLAQARPEVLLLGGDYVFLDFEERHAVELRRRIEGVPARVKLAVMGNHDLWTFDERIEQALRDAGVQILTNRSIVLPAPHDDVAIVGLDDPETGSPDAGAAFAGSEAASTLVVLCHSPDGLLHCDGYGVDLFLCGHTHGGQISTPWGPPVVSAGRLARRYVAGWYHAGATTVFVSRGVGGIEIPMRIGAPPDVGVFDLS